MVKNAGPKHVQVEKGWPGMENVTRVHSFSGPLNRVHPYRFVKIAQIQNYNLNSQVELVETINASFQN